MNPPFYNDQASIAEQYRLLEEYTGQMSRLALFKINSYRLSLVNSAFCRSKEELSALIKDTLLNYTDPVSVLADFAFFDKEIDN